LHGRLQDSDSADVVCLLSQICKDMSEKICNLQSEAATAGLKMNSKKTKERRINSKLITNINVNNVVIERVDKFTYLCSVVTVDRGALHHDKARIKKANGIFVELWPS
jgi:hypothetical protein